VFPKCLIEKEKYVAIVIQNSKTPLVPGHTGPNHRKDGAAGARRSRIIADAHEYQKLMSKAGAAAQAAVMIQRGKQRTRIETRILVPRHDFLPTARVQGKYDPDLKQILVISRGVAAMRLTVPEAWAGASLFWNGLTIQQIDRPGCVLLSIDKELLHARACL